ncbi:hypothetical protein N0V90_007329 [Kalmusia sp. IMI 367209]|nr:hypothetical protein N0V90_007329 [Kalmusia sp. IMI 367209]
MRLALVFAAWLPFGGALAYALDSVDQPLVARADDLKAAATSLQPLLSKNACIVLPADDEWDELQIRGTSPRIHPNYNVVVEVATEADVQKTVQIAAQFGIPFLAVAGTHGWTKTLNNLPFGIQINLRKLNSTTVDKGGKTATVGGGVLQWEATRALFAQNKQAGNPHYAFMHTPRKHATGGHSMLQARHGYAVDGLVSARVVLANGTVVTASSTVNPDLFWALKGAGHNFGIVTSMQLKVYDIQKNWTVYSFIYSSDKLEDLLTVVNRVDGNATRPANLVIAGVSARVADIDPNNPLIVYTVSYEGPESEAAPYAAYFQSVGPLVTNTATNVDYVALYTVTQNNLDSVACRKNLNAMGSGTSLPIWNTTSARAAFNVYTKLTADPRFAQSVFLLENYGMQGVKAVDASSTSLSLEERQYPIVANPTIWWNGTAPKDTADAMAYGEQIRQALFAGLPKGAKKHTYVNYAVGTEGFEQMYGYDSARVTRLKALKKVLDPKGRFNYYNPVPTV